MMMMMPGLTVRIFLEKALAGQLDLARRLAGARAAL
jgi:hypothetical protein